MMLLNLDSIVNFKQNFTNMSRSVSDWMAWRTVHFKTMKWQWDIPILDCDWMTPIVILIRFIDTNIVKVH